MKKEVTSMIPRVPIIIGRLRKWLWSIIIIVIVFLIYAFLGELIPKYWEKIGFKAIDRAILAMGFFVILLISLRGLAIMSGKLSSLAITDGLTGLYNQFYIKERLQEEIYRSERYKHILSLLMIDLEDFKSLNDKYGHIVGDRILKSFSNLIRETVRPSDIPSRYGGEEFLVVLPETTCENAVIVAERIRQKIGGYPFEISCLKEKNPPFTVSIGVCAFPGRGRTVEELITLADTALYQAKKDGKNRVAAAKI